MSCLSGSDRDLVTTSPLPLGELSEPDPLWKLSSLMLLRALPPPSLDEPPALRTGIDTESCGCFVLPRWEDPGSERLLSTERLPDCFVRRIAGDMSMDADVDVIDPLPPPGLPPGLPSAAAASGPTGERGPDELGE